jgi:NAD(P)H-hydrate epimerase
MSASVRAKRLIKKGTSMPASLSRAQVRDVDRRAIAEYGVPGVVLMENAGRGAAELLRSLDIAGTVVIACGKGNNGGDGFVIARHLDNAGIATRILLFAPPESLTGDAAINYHIVAKSGLDIRIHADASLDEASLRQDFAGADWIVDALFGTGLSGPLRAPFDRIVEIINGSGVKVFAVDIPSGLDCDAGRPLGPTVRAQHTATFVALKKGFAEQSAREWLGQVHVIDIGAPRVLVADVARHQPGEPGA